VNRMRTWDQSYVDLPTGGYRAEASASNRKHTLHKFAKVRLGLQDVSQQPLLSNSSYRERKPKYAHWPSANRLPNTTLNRVEHISSRRAQWYRKAILTIGSASAQAVQATFLALTPGTAHDVVWGTTRITEMKNG